MIRLKKMLTKSVRRSLSMALISLLSATSFVLLSQTSPSEFPVSAYECTQVSINDIDETLLTREERIALMDTTLSDSIDSYTSCVNTVQSEMSGGGGGGSGGAGGGGEQGSSQGQGADQQGQQAGGNEQPQQDSQGNGSPQAGSAPVNTSSQSTTQSQRGVIAPKDNDSIICKLLFDEIRKTTGPSLAGLEKQYRDYQCGK